MIRKLIYVVLLILMAVALMAVDKWWHTRDQLPIPQFTDEQNEQICIEEEIY